MSEYQQYDIAVVGATGLVGEALLGLLQERQFPVASFTPIGSSDSAASQVSFQDSQHKVVGAENFDFQSVQLVWLCCPADQAPAIAQVAVDAGCMVIDLSGGFVDQPEIPLVLADYNSELLAEASYSRVVACPSSTALAAVQSLKGVEQEVGLERVWMTSYLSASCAGRKGVEALAKQTAQLLNARPVDSDFFGRQLAFNLISEDAAEGFDLVQHEARSQVEIARLLQRADLDVAIRATLVPCFHGQSADLVIDTQAYMGVDEFVAHCNQQQNVEYDAQSVAPTPVGDAVGQSQLLVARAAEPFERSQSLSYWLAWDNLQYGAALNAVQLGELLIEHYL